MTSTNVLQRRTNRSGSIVSREVISRLSTLRETELEIVANGTAQERSHVMWVAACRRYSLIAEFAQEVVREKFLLMTPLLTLEDFDGFVRTKSLWHDELNNIAESTYKKLRQNVFRMLRDAALLSEAGHIVQPLLSTRVVEALAAPGGVDLRFFPLTDSEIESAT